MNAPDDDGSLSIHTQQTLVRLASLMAGTIKVSQSFD